MLSKGQQKRIRQLGMKKFRMAEGLFVAEGPKVVGDLLRAGFVPEDIYATPDSSLLPPDSSLLPSDSSPLSCPLLPAPHHSLAHYHLTTDDDLAKASFLQHPQGIIGIFRIPAQQDIIIPENDLTLMLDGIQDPGNLGTIIRIADWFGIRQVICSPDTADAYSPKVVQATMGSIARVTLSYQPLQPLLESLPTNFPVYGTLLDGNNIYRQQLTNHGIIIMGNEGNGISAPIRQLITHRILIPSFGNAGAESLNVAVATAITCSEFRRSQAK